MSSPISAAGLVIDVAGALTLAMSLMFKQPAAMLTESGTYVGANPYFFFSQVKQTADAQVGAALLAIGFVLQLEGALGWHPAWAQLYWTLPMAAIADVAAVALLLPRWRRWHLRRAITVMMRGRAVTLSGSNSVDPLDQWRQAIERWAEMMGVTRRNGEAWETFGERAYGAQWPELHDLGSQFGSIR
jgi:hypothetical protein